MRQNYCLYAASKEGHMNLNDVPPRQLSKKLSVDDILYLQQLFLTTGLHHIVVPDLSVGRKIIHSLLQSMHYFSNTACLTQQHKVSLKGYDVLGRLINYCGQEANSNVIEEYFLEEFEADFMWVELNEELMQNPFAVQVFRIMHVLDIIKKMPVVTISYQKQ
jgi:hypothetical protein